MHFKTKGRKDMKPLQQKLAHYTVPQETKAAYDGACLYDWLCMMTEENDMMPEPDYGYSGRRYSMHMPIYCPSPTAC